MHGIRVFSASVGVACGLVAALVAFPAQASVAPATPHQPHVDARPAPAPPTGSPTWRVDARLPPDTAQQQEFSNGFWFNDVEAAGPHDAWAVGTQGRNLPGYWARPAMRHWHDGRWLRVSVPAWMDGSAPGGWVNELQAVGGSSPDDVWAIGPIFGDVSSLDRAVHWNGKRWAKAGVLPSASSAPRITSVLSFGPDNVWAFGCYCFASQGPYIAHFSNGTWHDVTPAGLPFGGIWTGAATSPSNIWAVMSETDTGSFTVLRWNGAKWKVVPVPATFSGFAPGGGIVVTKNDGVWFAGYLVSNFTGAVLHTVGGKWYLTQTKTPTPMEALVPDGRGGLWSSTGAFGNASAEIWHLAAGKWNRVADPAGVTGEYLVVWMAHVPDSATTLAVGPDMKNELLLSYP